MIGCVAGGEGWELVSVVPTKLEHPGASDNDEATSLSYCFKRPAT